MDSLENLPIDRSRNTSEEEMVTLKKYSKPKSKSSGGERSTWNELKVILLSTILFLLMSTEFFDKFISFIPYTDTQYIKIGIKGLVFAVALFAVFVMTS